MFDLPRLRLVLIAAIVAGSQAATRAEVPLHTIVTSGFPVPGAPAGVTVTDFVFPVINNSGHISFMGHESGGRFGTWSNSTGTLSLLARSGFTPSSTPQIHYNTILGALLSDDGRTAFTAISNSGGGITAVFSGTPGNLTEIARSYQPAPGLPDGSYFTLVSRIGGIISTPSFNAQGQSAFFAQAEDSQVGVRNGIWSEGHGNLAPVAVTDMQVPGMPDQTFFESIGQNVYSPPLNDLGEVAFAARYYGAANGRGIFAERAGSLSLVANSKDQAPGQPPGVLFNSFEDPTINNHSHTAFWATLSGPGITLNNDLAMFSESGGILHGVAQEGTQAPDVENGATFNFFNKPWLSGSDKTLVFAQLAGPGINTDNDNGYWIESGGALRLAVRDGMPAPGTESKTLINIFGDGSQSNVRAAMNSAGQFAFDTYLTGPDVTTANNRAIFATDPLGNLQLVIRKGQSVEISPGVFRTISNFYFFPYSGEDGYERSFNAYGQLVLDVYFAEGGTAVIIADIPEPTTILLVCLAAAFRRRRRARRSGVY